MGGVDVYLFVYGQFEINIKIPIKINNGDDQRGLLLPHDPAEATAQKSSHNSSYLAVPGRHIYATPLAPAGTRTRAMAAINPSSSSSYCAYGELVDRE